MYPFLIAFVACGLFFFEKSFPVLRHEASIRSTVDEYALEATLADSETELSMDELFARHQVPPVAELPDTGAALLNQYRDRESKEKVITYLGEIAGSRSLAMVILNECDKFNIDPSLAFALAWEESRFMPRAINRSNANRTIDRGLFQLNSNSFPRLSEEDFFNPSLNAYYGLSHLAWCLEAGGSVVSGLAMYNAGTTRVKNSGAPKRTLDYTSRIMQNSRNIEDYYLAHFAT
jgi:soluble lytic murein transglycosylase-like protein